MWSIEKEHKELINFFKKNDYGNDNNHLDYIKFT